MGIDMIFKVRGLDDKCARKFLLYCIQNLKICIKNQQFAAIISQFWCIFGYATIITLCFGLSLKILPCLYIIIESVDSISRDGPHTPIYIITSPVAIYFFAVIR